MYIYIHNLTFLIRKKDWENASALFVTEQQHNRVVRLLFVRVLKYYLKYKVFVVSALV